jgi:hypothetical protein
VQLSVQIASLDVINLKQWVQLFTPGLRLLGCVAPVAQGVIPLLATVIPNANPMHLSYSGVHGGSSGSGHWFNPSSGGGGN